MLKFATAQIIAAEYGGQRRVTKAAHRAVFQYEARPGYLYVRSRAISSRCNDNWDEFPAEEIKAAYKTFIGKPVFVNHTNDNHRRARGVIIDAALHEDSNPDGTPDTWAEVLMEVDAKNFPKLAKAILAGHVDRTSMGCDVAYSICSACGNRATTPAEYCAHIPGLKGKPLYRHTASGRRVGESIREICHGLGFFENSLLVEPPADPTAHFLGVDSSALDKTASRRTANWDDEDEEEYDEDGYDSTGHDRDGYHRSYPKSEASPDADLSVPPHCLTCGRDIAPDGFETWRHHGDHSWTNNKGPVSDHKVIPHDGRTSAQEHERLAGDTQAWSDRLELEQRERHEKKQRVDKMFTDVGGDRFKQVPEDWFREHGVGPRQDIVSPPGLPALTPGMKQRLVRRRERAVTESQPYTPPGKQSLNSRNAAAQQPPRRPSVEEMKRKNEIVDRAFDRVTDGETSTHLPDRWRRDMAGDTGQDNIDNTPTGGRYRKTYPEQLQQKRERAVTESQPFVPPQPGPQHLSRRHLAAGSEGPLPQGVRFQFEHRNPTAPGDHLIAATVPHPETGKPVSAGYLTWDSNDGTVNMIHTEPEHRRRGLGNAMWLRAHEVANERGIVPPKHSPVRTHDGQDWSRGVDQQTRVPTPGQQALFGHDADGINGNPTDITGQQGPKYSDIREHLKHEHSTNSDGLPDESLHVQHDALHGIHQHYHVHGSLRSQAAGPAYDPPETHPWYQQVPLSHENVLHHWEQANDEEKAQGERWYPDAHLVAKAIAKLHPDIHTDAEAAHKGAGVLSAYSPQQNWWANQHNAARSFATGNAIGKGEGLMVMASHAKAAQRILDGEDHQKVLKGPKTQDFAHLIEHGGMDGHGNPSNRVVIDRHALSVAAGRRLSSDEGNGFPGSSRHYYEHAADQYRKAAAVLSDREKRHIPPHAVQAVTWLVRQRLNADEDQNSPGGKGRQTVQRNQRQQWKDLAAEHTPELKDQGNSHVARHLVDSVFINADGTINVMAANQEGAERPNFPWEHAPKINLPMGLKGWDTPERKDLFDARAERSATDHPNAAPKDLPHVHPGALPEGWSGDVADLGDHATNQLMHPQGLQPGPDNHPPAHRYPGSPLEQHLRYRWDSTNEPRNGQARSDESKADMRAWVRKRWQHAADKGDLAQPTCNHLHCPPWGHRGGSGESSSEESGSMTPLHEALEDAGHDAGPGSVARQDPPAHRFPDVTDRMERRLRYAWERNTMTNPGTEGAEERQKIRNRWRRRTGVPLECGHDSCPPWKCKERPDNQLRGKALDDFLTDFFGDDDLNGKREASRHVARYLVDPVLINADGTLSALAYGEIKAPADVDTLREEDCPVCGDKDTYDGQMCNVCGFISPPEQFRDPDLDAAKRMDLRKQVVDPTMVDDNGQLQRVDGQEDPDGQVVDDGQVDQDGTVQDNPMAGFDENGLLPSPYGDQNLDGTNPGASDRNGDGIIQPSEIDQDGNPQQQMVDPEQGGQPMPRELPYGAQDHTGQPFTPGPDVPSRPDEPEGPQELEQGELAPDMGQEPIMGRPDDGIPDLLCPSCGFQADATPPQTQDMGNPSVADDGVVAGDVCPNCQKAQLLTPGEANGEASAPPPVTPKGPAYQNQNV